MNVIDEKYYCIKPLGRYIESHLYRFIQRSQNNIFGYKCISHYSHFNINETELNTYFIPYRIKLINDILNDY